MTSLNLYVCGGRTLGGDFVGRAHWPGLRGCGKKHLISTNSISSNNRPEISTQSVDQVSTNLEVLLDESPPIRRPSSNDLLRDNFSPVRELENGVTNEGFVVLEGAIPTSLRGLLVRNGPNPDRKPREETYHPWDGDGMLHGIWLGGGNELEMRYKNKFVDTLGKRVENMLDSNKEEGIYPYMAELRDPKMLIRMPLLGFLKSIFPAWIHGLKQDAGDWGDTPPGINSKNVANTSVVYHHGKLLALWEAGMPYEVDVRTLETIGVYSSGGTIKQCMSAHPKIDPENGEMMEVRYSLLSAPHCTVRVWNKQGMLLHEEGIQGVSKPVLMHDCAVTKQYILILDFPLTFKMPGKEYMKGERGLFYLMPERGGRIGAMPRFGKDQDIKWFDVSPNFIFHTMNAFEDGDKIVLQSSRMEKCIDGWDPIIHEAPALACVHEYELDMISGEAKERPIPTSIQYLEMPTLHPAFLGRKARFLYAVGFVSPDDTFRFNSCEKVDLLSSQCSSPVHHLPPGFYCGEFVFAPRHCNDKDSGALAATKQSHTDGSDDGWLLTVAHNENTDKSELYIIDAVDMKLVARVQLPARVPYGFHTVFIPENQLPKNYSLV